ncbi:fumarylacetoacetase [Xylariomycetidae sp. FL2044]|nr:fumarylacetoacetase [Xylariomycetidae sp. FL2044]KAH9904811.1 fumarylacetoacetase [Xylariomycetidae sp. FL2044]
MSYADHFSIANIPYGVASDESHPNKGVVTRLGDDVFFLADLDIECSEAVKSTFTQPTLNALAATSKKELKQLRVSLQKILSDSSVVASHGKAVGSITLHMPLAVGGFTDYSCSREHGLNASEAIFGKQFNPPSFSYFPIGYSGRPSSVVVSGTPIRRPCGVYKTGETIEYKACAALDYELEMACVIGKPSKWGEPVPLKDVDEHIFGIVLLNDWSARDIQGFEMMPLGPMNSKSFGTSISPWIITLEALEPFETVAPSRDIPAPAYLQETKEKPGYKITLESEFLHDGEATKLCRSDVSWMYWTFRDLVAQQTVNGCNVNTGDLLATGTVSGQGDDEHGCLLETTRGGKLDFTLSNGRKRTYLEDGDGIRMTGYAGGGVGFGDCSGFITPARVL